MLRRVASYAYDYTPLSLAHSEETLGSEEIGEVLFELDGDRSLDGKRGPARPVVTQNAASVAEVHPRPRSQDYGRVGGHRWARGHAGPHAGCGNTVGGVRSLTWAVSR